MLTKLCNDKGSALIISLLLMGMLTLLAVMAVRSSNTDMDLAFNQINCDKTFYIAEAGGRAAFAELNNDPSWRTGYNNISFNGGSYIVQITDSATNAALADTVIITSTGWITDAQAAVEMTLVPGIVHPFKYAMFADDDIELKNGMSTDSYNSDSGSYAATRDTLYGDVGSNDDITMHNGSYVGGDVTTSSDSSSLSINGGATVTGDIRSDAPEETLDPIPQSEFDWAAANNDNLSGISDPSAFNSSTGAFETKKTVTLSDGVYYFSSVILKNSAELKVAPGADVTIYVTGDIEIKNSGDVNGGGDPGSLIFYSQGDIVLKNSGEIYGVFYSPDGDADLRNSADFYGSVIANTIVVHNSAAFHYDRNLASITMSGSGSYNLVAWREL